MKSSFGIAAVTSLILVWALSLRAQDAVTISVTANMDLYRAGGYDDGSDGIAPAIYSFPARHGRTVTFPSISGSWACGSVPEYSADGTSTGSCYQTGGLRMSNPIGPFSGYALTDFVGALAGVFLEDSLPTQAPPPLRFYIGDNSKGGIQTNFKTLAPRVGQIFFVGDGLTGTGAGQIQSFLVPPTATHLYLGYVDHCGSNINAVPGCYSDNVGTLSAADQLHNFTLNWVNPQPSQPPPPRAAMGMTYDAAAHVTLMFGGFTNPDYLNDTWTWTLTGGWSQLHPAVSPAPREGPGMVYDGTTGNVLLFGGKASNGAYLNDTWTWDGVNWEQQFPIASPPARVVNSDGMVYDDGTGTVLLFGGSNSGILGDTWTWDGLTTTWMQQFPTSSPSPRGAPMAYDKGSHTVVLFGGSTNSEQFNDTWTWDGAEWTQRFPAVSPSPRTAAEAAYDSATGAVILFGGYNGNWPNSLDDTWSWNGVTWEQVNPATVPPNRYSAGMTYDPTTKSVVMFGGFSSGPGRNDTWLFGWVPVKP